MEYSIDSYYTEGGNVFMIFKNKKNKKIEVNLKKDFPEYCCGQDVLSTYYRDQNGTILKISPPANSRVVIIDGDNIYRRITQFELDRYESRFPDSDNGKLYSYLIEKF